MDISLILSFLGASILLTIMPGPDIIYVVLESITRGAKTGITIASGLVSGLIVHTTLAALGLALILEQSSTAFNVLKIVGALYLFHLAFQASQEKPPIVELESNNSPKSSFALWRKGFLMNVLNPKVSLFFIALLPQFVSPDGLPPAAQMIILGIIFMIQAMIIFSLVSLSSGKLNRYLENSNFWQITKWAKIIVLLILALGLLCATR